MVTKASILSFVNAVLNRSETDVDEYIKLVLQDLSDLHVLKEQDTSLSVTSSDEYVAFPSDALSDPHAIISVVMTDSSGERQWPLDPVVGGWREFNRDLSQYTDSDRSTPTHYVANDRKIYLSPPPNGTFTIDLWYYKRHADTADTIEFDDSWMRALKFGTAAEVAMAKKLPDYIAMWKARYDEERNKQRMIHSNDVRIVGDHI